MSRRGPPNFHDWFAALPPVTRGLVVCAAGSTLATTLGVCSPYLLVLTPDAVYRLQVWRFATNLVFFGGFGLPLLVNFYLLVTYASQLEAWMTQHHQHPHYFLYFMLLSGALLNAVGLAMGLPVMSQSLVPLVLYVFCRTRPNQVFHFFFDLQIRALYFPWVMMVLHLMLGSPIRQDVVGCVVGHVYVYATHIRGRGYYYPPDLFGRLVTRAAGGLRRLYAHIQGHDHGD